MDKEQGVPGKESRKWSAEMLEREYMESLNETFPGHPALWRSYQGISEGVRK